MAPSSTSVDPALCQLAKERGTSGLIKDGGDEVVAYTLVTSHLTTIAIENKVCQSIHLLLFYYLFKCLKKLKLSHIRYVLSSCVWHVFYNCLCANLNVRCNR